MTDLAAYRRLRNMLWLLMAVAWLIWSWSSVSAWYTAEIANIKECDRESYTTGQSIYYAVALEDCGNDKRILINQQLVLGLTARALVLPFLFWPARFLARVWREQRELSAAAREHAATRARLAKAEAAASQRLAQYDDEAKRSKHAIHRGDFIQKLGTVGDLLDLLAHENDTARMAKIRQGIAQSLRDVSAKHSLDELRTMLSRDESLRIALGAVLKRLSTVGLGEGAEAIILTEALDRCRTAARA